MATAAHNALDAEVGRDSRSTELPFERRHLAILLGITLFAAALRLFRLGEWSLWVDEVHTYRDFTVDESIFWSDASRVRYYPASFQLMRWLAPFLPSLGEGWLRLPFAFFGIATVPTIALMGRLIVGRGAALAAALLLAVSPWHIFWSQNCRSYSMLLFFALMASAAWWQAVHKRAQIWYLGAVLCLVLAGLCHFSAYFLSVAFGLHWLVAWRGRGRAQMSFLERWLPAIVLVVVAITSPWTVPVVLEMISHVQRSKGGASVVHLVSTTVYFLRLPLVIAAIGGILWLRDRVRHGHAFLVYWALVPPCAVAIWSAVANSQVNAQYTFAMLPAFCLLGGAVVVAMHEHLRAPGWRGVALRLVPVSLIALDMVGYDYLYFTKQFGDRPRVREAAFFVRDKPGERKLILTTNEPGMRYYLTKDIVSRPFADEERLHVRSFEPWLREWDPFTGQHFPDGKRLSGDAYLRLVAAYAKNQGITVYVVASYPELEEKDDDNTLIPFIRGEMLQVAWFPNWTGPKDMCMFVAKLP